MNSLIAQTAPRLVPGGLLRPALLLLSLTIHAAALVWLVSGHAPSLLQPAATRAIQVSWVERPTPVRQWVPPEPMPLPMAQQPRPEKATPQAAPKPTQAPALVPTHASDPMPVREKEPRAVPAPVTSSPVFDAAYLQNPPPVYPRASLRLREEGDVMLRVRVAADGTPREITLSRSSGSARLDRAALDAVERWQFIAAQRAGMAVEAWVIVPITFKLENS